MRSALFPALSQPKPPVRHPPEGIVAAQRDEDLVVERAAVPLRVLGQNHALDLGGRERALPAPEDLLAQRPNRRTTRACSSLGAAPPRQEFGDLPLDQPGFTKKPVSLLHELGDLVEAVAQRQQPTELREGEGIEYVSGIGHIWPVWTAG